jgi:hypothetical protein
VSCGWALRRRGFPVAATRAILHVTRCGESAAQHGASGLSLLRMRGLVEESSRRHRMHSVRLIVYRGKHLLLTIVDNQLCAIVHPVDTRDGPGRPGPSSDERSARRAIRHERHARAVRALVEYAGATRVARPSLPTRTQGHIYEQYVHAGAIVSSSEPATLGYIVFRRRNGRPDHDDRSASYSPHYRPSVPLAGVLQCLPRA